MNKSTEERFDWINTHFDDAKKIALFYIDLLEKMIDGSKIIRTRRVRAFAQETLGLDLSASVADGLFNAGANGVIPGPIYRMGLEPRLGAYKTLPQSVALKYLQEMRQKILDLDILPTTPSEYYESGPGIFLTPMTREKIAKREADSIISSEFLQVGELYSRKDISSLFGIGVEGFSRGLFKSKSHKSIWIFVTRDKTSDRTPYDDNLVGDLLYWDGEDKGGNDDLVIHHIRDGNEILLFYREKRDQFPNFEFRYEGKFEYLDHDKGTPSKFHLHRIHEFDELNERDAEIDSDYEEYIEGNERYSYRKHYERDRKLRKATIKIHGFKCMACGFDFEKFYGPIGRDFIQVHHLIPVSTSEGPRKVDPESEMAVVCSNCHSMIHRNRKKAIPIDVLKQLVEKHRSNL